MAGSRKTTYAMAVKWAYSHHMKVELLESLEADRPRPLPLDASDEARTAHEEAAKEWTKRERKRRHDMLELERKAPTDQAYMLLIEATESEATRKEFRRKHHDVQMKAKEEEKAQEQVQRDDERRMFPFFEALYRERPHLAESARSYHAGRKYRTRPDTAERNRARARHAEAPPVEAAPGESPAGAAADAAPERSEELATAGT